MPIDTPSLQSHLQVKLPVGMVNVKDEWTPVSLRDPLRDSATLNAHCHTHRRQTPSGKSEVMNMKHEWMPVSLFDEDLLYYATAPAT